MSKPFIAVCCLLGLVFIIALCVDNFLLPRNLYFGEARVPSCYSDRKEDLSKCINNFIGWESCNVRVWRKNLVVAIMIGTILTSIIRHFELGPTRYNQNAFLLSMSSFLMFSLLTWFDNFWAFHGIPIHMLTNVLGTFHN